MTDRNEIEALKASFRGALRTAESVADMKDRIEALNPTDEPSSELLEHLTRVTAAHALAAAALRGLVATMVSRRSGTEPTEPSARTTTQAAVETAE